MTHADPTPRKLATLLQEGSAAVGRLEARILLQLATGYTHAELIARDHHEVTSEQLTHYTSLLARRKQGEPIAYIVGRREFHGLNLCVGPAVLIPRPDTETLVDLAIDWLAGKAAPSILDLGTGSGAIALALAKAYPHARITAIDASTAALNIAKHNGQQLGLAVEWLHGSWFEPVAARRFDLIVSNPPYIAAADPHLTQGDVAHEPLSALVSGQDGLDDLRHIIQLAPEHLTPDGALMLEHGYDQATSVCQLLAQEGFNNVGSTPDLAGILRVSHGQLAS